MQIINLDNHYLNVAKDVFNGLDTLNARFSGKKIYLTGSAGFLGVQFIHYFTYLNDSRLLDRPCYLFASDNFLRGKPNWISKFENRNDVGLNQDDIITQKNIPTSDFIIHAASIASPTFYRLHPIATMDANVIGLRNLLNHATDNKPEGFLFFSTSEIYGDPTAENIPTPETYRGNVSCTGPRACYDESKRFGETLCVNFQKTNKVPVVTVRPFNNYGPGLRISDRRVICDFFRDSLANKDIMLLSDGKATRTFCYVSDAIEGYLRALLIGRPGESYNIGAEKPEISMLELAKKIIALTGSKNKVIRGFSDDNDYTTDNPQRRCPNITKAKYELKYSPRINLDEGLKRSYEFYKDHSNE